MEKNQTINQGLLAQFSDDQIFEEAAKRKKIDKEGEQGEEKEGYPCVCSACKKETTVPFKPRQDWPVYCRECYEKRRRY